MACLNASAFPSLNPLEKRLVINDSATSLQTRTELAS
jgi:hypothetical protein